MRHTHVFYIEEVSDGPRRFWRVVQDNGVKQILAVRDVYFSNAHALRVAQTLAERFKARHRGHMQWGAIPQQVRRRCLARKSRIQSELYADSAWIVKVELEQPKEHSDDQRAVP